METNVEESPSTQRVEGLESYLALAQSLGVTPNFWLSREYLEKAKAAVREYGGWVWVVDDNDEVIFPPLPYGFDGSGPIAEKFWSDHSNENCGRWYDPVEFLDYEFIYNPNNFKSLEGSHWKLFRKNVKKWPEENPGRFNYGDITDSTFESEIEDLVAAWIDSLVDDNIEDALSMLAFVRNGENRKGLWNSSGNLVGVNVWDENWRFINFRWCLTRPEPHLNSFMRLLFYRDPDILAKNKLVNDGGCVGRESLKFFKEKMNPSMVRKVYSYKLKSGDDKT